MAARRYAPARALPRGALLVRDRLDRKLTKLVQEVRVEQQHIDESTDLAERFGALHERCPGGDLQPVLAEALALTCAAAQRLVGQNLEVCGEPLRWDLVPRDNQVACAAALARGEVAELDTGEGKTLSVAMAAACGSLLGRLHVVTANDYLARRDHEWMAPLLELLGVDVGAVYHDVLPELRQAEYARRVTYVSVKEVGADYLRDTLSSAPESLNLPALEGALLDEVDFILVDEARVPLILAEQTDAAENLCHQFNEAVAAVVADQRSRVDRYHEELDEVDRQEGWSDRKRQFERTARLAKLLLADPLDPRLSRRLADAADAGDGQVVRRVKRIISRYERLKRREELLEGLLYTVDRKALAVQLTEEGIDRLVELFGDLFALPGMDPDEQAARRGRVRAVHNLLAAHVLYRRDHDYILKEDRVILVDQASGRPSFDRHLQYGLHRAIEAKEGLYPALDHQTAAEITFPGLFQLYDRWAGTSGTCLELSGSFKKAFGKEVVRIPPHRPVIRTDFEDVLFATSEDRSAALVSEVSLARMLRQPVLVGTNSVEASEEVSAALEKAGIPHEVLNARRHEREARIIARAGEPGAVTVATTMAGRGTDIRTPEDLAETIAEAVAVWAEEASTQPGGGVRLEVRTAEELATVEAALASRGLDHRTSKRRGATLVDVGVPPATAFPCVLGMRVIGFERLAEGRLDRQLRGRTGRQGAPGMSRCYLCLDDEVVLIHGDRSRLSELGRKASRRLDPLCERPVLSHRRLLEEVQRAWGILAATVERARERLQKLDAVDQEQREHYDAERRSLIGASGGGIAKLADQALERAARDLVREALAGEEHLSHEQLELIDDLTQIHFERRGLLAPLADLDVLPRPDRVEALLGERLKAIYAVARQWQGPEAMAVVERTVLLDALTGAWRDLSGRRPELREQSDLMAYAGKQPDHVYRGFAGIAYHETLAEAARTAASVLVTFPLPRELKTPRTGLQVTDPDILALFD